LDRNPARAGSGASHPAAASHVSSMTRKSASEAVDLAVAAATLGRNDNQIYRTNMATNLGASRPRYIHVVERDPDFPRDRDGCPTTTGVEWFLNPADVTALELSEDRADTFSAVIHVRGVAKPIHACEDGRGIAEQLGVFEAECQMCGRACAEGSSRCRSCEGMLDGCEDDDD
jgi:hypothetical protein